MPCLKEITAQDNSPLTNTTVLVKVFFFYRIPKMPEIKNRSKFIEDLKRHEGFKDHIYVDHLDFKTFGYGHKITPQDPEYNQPLNTKVLYNFSNA